MGPDRGQQREDDEGMEAHKLALLLITSSVVAVTGFFSTRSVSSEELAQIIFTSRGSIFSSSKVRHDKEEHEESCEGENGEWAIHFEWLAAVLS
ncbi:MAG: hypothetical protein Q9227_002566, partial [Pyrenula ochraceoflavens]